MSIATVDRRMKRWQEQRWILDAVIRTVGHAFKGSSAPFGFPEAGRLGAELEEAATRGDREAIAAIVPLLKAALPPDGPSHG